MVFGWRAILVRVGVPLACVSLSGATLAGEPVDSSLVERAQVRLVRLPVILEEDTPGSCDGLRPEQIEVLEDGASAEVTHLEPAHLEGVHAILMDSSRPMLGALQETIRAARTYIESLSRSPSAMLASFDDSLILHSPLTTDRSRLADDLIWIETGWGSNLWDSVRQMVLYLASRPERKILVVLTDGCDTQDDAEVRPRDVIERAARIPSLVAFPVVIESSNRCEGARDTRSSLSALAGRTGGRYFEIESSSEVKSTLLEVRAGLERERYVSYRPIPFGSGPKDKAKRESLRWRKLAVRFSGKKDGCRIVLSGQARRLESASRRTFTGDILESDDIVVEPFNLGEGGRIARGEIRDVVKDSGPLFHSRYGWVDKYFESAERSLATREVLAIVPPLDRVIRPDTRPEDAVIDALGLAPGIPGIPNDAPTHATWSEVPFIINGRSLQGVRASLAASLFDHPDYRRWAYEKIRAERLAHLDDLVSRGGKAVDPEQVDALRKFLAGEDWVPESSELQRYLAAWLGDVPAVEFFTGVERRFAEVLLTMSETGAETFFADAERLWKNLDIWLPPPRDVRLLGLLVPEHDADRDVVGFYRVVLPRPQSFLGAWRYSAEVPYGLRLVRWMTSHERLAGLLRERFVVEDVAYPDGPAQEFGGLLGDAALDKMHELFDWSRFRLVQLRLARRDVPGKTSVVHGYYPTRDPSAEGVPPDGFCILPPVDPPADGVERRLLEALIEAKSHASIPCVLQLGESG